LLLSAELMINAVTINLVGFSRFSGGVTGQVFAVFTIALTVAEVVVGLAIVILLFRWRRGIAIDSANELRR
jgi:NADH-quinone oxidoreductase subunit K